ncbi:MAG: hypothetical protein Q7J42_13975 [Sulfuritalea sp.]|nr:hypothetical protein [Sulfuritalea sp.]
MVSWHQWQAAGICRNQKIVLQALANVGDFAGALSFTRFAERARDELSSKSFKPGGQHGEFSSINFCSEKCRIGGNAAFVPQNQTDLNSLITHN